LLCEYKPTYCPALRSASADFYVAPGLLTDEEPWLVETIILNQTLPVEADQLGATVNLACPLEYQRVRGDESIVCNHGADGQGTWQVAGAETTTLVDHAIAEPLVCELDTIFGVSRHFFTTTVKAHGGPGQDGYDVVPNIDQTTSAFDAAYFKTFLTPPRTGKYTLYVEVVGRFLLSFQEKVLLTGRSQNSKPKRFKSGVLSLLKGEYYAILLQYALDPAMPEVKDPAPVPRHVRLLWQSDDTRAINPAVVVPPSALRHSFTPLYGYPRRTALVNDPNPCAKEPVQMYDMLIGATGYISHGTVGRDYNADLECLWHMTSKETVRFNFYINFFDVQPSELCVADSLIFRMGLTGDIIGTYCGGIAAGPFLTMTGVDFSILFKTDGLFESRGFNITWVLADTGTQAIL